MSISENAQVSGGSIQAFVAGMPDDPGELLAKYNLPAELVQDQWYSQKSYAEMMCEVDAQTFMTEMVGVGLQIARHAVLPPTINSLESALSSMDVAYQMNHRNIAEGEGWTFEKVDENTYFVVDRTPYPKNFSYGVVYGFVERFAEGKKFSVYVEDQDGYPAYRVVLK